MWPTVADDLSDDDLDRLYAWPQTSWVRSNMIESADGAAQSPGGGTRTLSSDADRRIMGTIRSLADAIVVGAGSARIEGYSALRPRPRYVEQRAAADQSPTPALVLVSHSLDFDLSGRLFQDALTRTIVITTDSSPAAKRAVTESVADVIVCGDDEVDLALMIDVLQKRGLTRIVAEGGPTLLGSLLEANLINDMAITIAPVLVGDYVDHSPTRIIAGAKFPAPVALQLAHLLEQDGALFARYEVTST